MRDIRLIDAALVTETVKNLLIEANYRLPCDVSHCMARAEETERDSLAKSVLARLNENARLARELDVPICQDTGMAVVFAEVGEDVHVSGATLEEAVNAGVSRAYLEGALRCSVVSDPLYDRRNTDDNTPAVLHICTVKGSTLRLTAAPKGFGSENMAFLKMMTPASGEEDVLNFVIDSVKRAGSNPCPPIVVGVGIGSDFEGVALLAKRALLRELGTSHRDNRYANLEKRMLSGINALGIGAQGFGGDTTALAVHIETAPTHIAGLPVAVNIACHVSRHATAVI